MKSLKMFIKPLNLVLVYIVIALNMLFLMLPIMVIVLPFIEVKSDLIQIDSNIFEKFSYVFWFLMFVVCFLMSLYLVLDFLFGFSLKSSLKNCIPYEKIKDYDFLTDLFKQVKDKFGESSVRLYIKNVNQVNAYAVSGAGSKAIVLTKGIIDHYLVASNDPKIFLYSLRSVISHEMSHLINKDFLPTFLIITNQKITIFVSRVIQIIFNIFIKTFYLLPYFGKYISRFLNSLIRLLNFLINTFNRLIVFPFYEFLRRFLMRSVEYRCDLQSAKAFGGQNMALALSMMGSSGYFTLFSTHPNSKSRINRVKNVKIEDKIIKPSFSDSLTNYLSLFLLMFLMIYFAKMAKIDILIRSFLLNHEVIYNKLLVLWHLLKKIY